MANVTIIYGSTTGNTETAANDIAEALSAHAVTVKDVSSVDASDLEGADLLILGTSTWGYGDIQDDWEANLSVVESASLSGKKVALFGLGDSGSYCDTFTDGMGILYEAVKAAGADVIGQVSTEGYTYDASKSEVDGMFVGLPIDDDTSDENPGRISAWVAELESKL